MTLSLTLVALFVFLLLVLAGRIAGRALDRRLDDDARRAFAEAAKPMATAGGEGLDIVARARKGPIVASLILVVACYVIGFGGALVLAVRAEWVDTGSAAATLGIGLAAGAAWLLGFAALSLYAVAGAMRFGFHDRGLSVATWRGWRLYAWGDVRQASLCSFKGSVSLVLAFDGLAVVEVPLDEFEEPKALLHAISRRLPMPVPGAFGHRLK